MKTSKIIFVLPILALILSFITFAICVVVKENAITKQYGSLTGYEIWYVWYSLWWVFLIFITICIVDIWLALKYKNKLAFNTALVLTVVLLVISFSFLKNKKNYSTSLDNLKKIERELNYTFPDQTTILLSEKDVMSSTKEDSATLFAVGVIRFPQTTEGKSAIMNDLEWESDIKKEIKQLLPAYFYQQIELYKIDCFLYSENNDNVITFLAYDTKNDVIYFAIVNQE